MKLFQSNFHWNLNIRALGVRVTHLTDGKIQCDLFDSDNTLMKKQSLETTIERLRSRFGYEIIRRGNILVNASLSGINPHSEIHIIHPVGFFKAK